MNTQLMSDLHQGTPWAWPLARHQVQTLAAVPAQRWLRVDEGCVWITAREGGPDADDVWLTAGQSLALPAGTEWLVQAWPQARLSLLHGAPVAVSRVAARLRAWRTWLRPQRLQFGVPA